MRKNGNVRAITYHFIRADVSVHALFLPRTSRNARRRTFFIRSSLLRLRAAVYRAIDAVLKPRSLGPGADIRGGLRGLACFYAAVVVAGADDLGFVTDALAVSAAVFLLVRRNAVAGGVGAFLCAGHIYLLGATDPDVHGIPGIDDSDADGGERDAGAR
jgi:hypothetical protein